MRAVLTAVIAAIEAAAVAVAVFFVIAATAGLLWWLVFDLAAEPETVATTAVAIWQLAHLVPMQISLSAATSLSLGLPAEPLSFMFSLAPLGLTLVTASLAFRSGWRFAGRGSSGVGAVIGGTLGFGVAASAAALFSAPLAVWPLPLEIVVVTLVYALPIALAFVVRSALDAQEWWLTFTTMLLRVLHRIAPRAGSMVRERAVAVLRLALASLLGLVGLGALGVTVALIAGYVDVIALGQSMHLDVLGAVLVFLVQLSLVPVAWIWSLAWFAGPGFAVGAATSVSPFEVLLGPLPTLPMLGALPDAWGWAGALAPALVVALGAAVGGLLAAGGALRRASTTVSLVVPVCAAVLVGLVVTLLASMAHGSIGPGRLAEVGPNAWLVGGVVAAELAFGMSLGVFARRFDVDRLRHSATLATLLSTEETVRSLRHVDDEAEQLAGAQHADTQPAGAQGGAISVSVDAETVPLDPLPMPDNSNEQLVSNEPLPDERDSLLREYSWDAPSEAANEPKSAGWRDRMRSKRGRKTD